MSGLCLAIRLKQSGIHDFTIIEKSNDVGGAWLQNSYPNAGCDVPSHLYSYSFAPSSEWSCRYARQPEILEYFRNCADRFDVRSHIVFQTEVMEAAWNEETQQWTITLDDGTVFVLADELDPEGLEVGNEVLLTYTEGDNGTLFVSLIEITE